MNQKELMKVVINALEDKKVQDLIVIDVSEKSSFTDAMVIATGGTNRQVKALADNVIEEAKINGVQPLGVEGEKEAEWILVDLGDVVVHLMQPAIRDFYQLEKLWSTEAVDKAGYSA